MNDFEFVRSLPVGVRHVGNNCAIPALDPAALRVRRHLLLTGCQQIVWPHWRDVVDKETGEIAKKSEFRVSICCRQSVSENVKIYRNGETVGFSGLYRCGNVWACPICCAKIMRRQSERIAALFKHVHKHGGSAVMMTLTAAHSLNDPLLQTLESFKNAKRAFTNSRTYKAFAELKKGSVSSTEITYSPAHGWHPHQHDAWFFESSLPFDEEFLADALFPSWEKSCSKFNLKTMHKFKNRRVGLDIVRALDASEYLTKFDRERSWSLPDEMTAGRIKSARGESLTPWSILEDAILRGKDSPAAKLWLEYLRATRGKTCVSLRGARDLLTEIGITTNVTDFDDANAKGESETIRFISDFAFERLVHEGSLGRFLESARRGDFSQFTDFLAR